MKSSSIVVMCSVFAVMAVILIRIPLKVLDATLIVIMTAVIIRILFVLLLNRFPRTLIPEILVILAAVNIIIFCCFKEILYAHSARGVFSYAINTYCYSNRFIEPAVVFIPVLILNIVVFKGIYAKQYSLLARLSLDSLPAMQMKIDSDLSDDFISIDDAKILRRELHEKVDFTGAVDGLGAYQFYSLIFIGGLYIISLIYALVGYACDAAGAVSGWIADFIQYMTFYSFIGVSVVMITATYNLLISYNIIHDNSERQG